MRQAGILAAAGIFALENNVERLRDDHENARALARGLSDLGLEVETPETNIVVFEVPDERFENVSDAPHFSQLASNSPSRPGCATKSIRSCDSESMIS